MNIYTKFIFIFITLIFSTFYIHQTFADDCDIKFMEGSKNISEKFINCPPDFESTIEMDYGLVYENIRKSITTCMKMKEGVVTGEIYHKSYTAEIVVFGGGQAKWVQNYFRIEKKDDGTYIRAWKHIIINPFGVEVFPQLTAELANGGWDMDCQVIQDAIDEENRKNVIDNPVNFGK